MKAVPDPPRFSCKSMLTELKIEAMILLSANWNTAMKWALCAMFTAMFTAIFTAQGTWAQEIAGKAVSVSGKILIREAASPKANPRDLRVGDTVQAGQVINSSSNGSAKILMTDKSIIDIGSSTLFKVDEYLLKKGSDRKVSLSIDYGKVRTSVNQPVGEKGQYRFRTKTATMGVRGTEFIVQSEIANPSGAGAQAVKNEITVVSGTVSFTSPEVPRGQTMSLTTGSQLVVGSTNPADANKAEAPQVKQLSKQELQTAASDAKVTDKTFVQAVAIDKKSEGNAPPPPPSVSSNQGAQARPTSTSAALQVIAQRVDQDASKERANLPLAIRIPGERKADDPLMNMINPVAVGQPVNLKVVFVP